MNPKHSKTFRGVLFAAALGTTFLSCKKENNNEAADQSNSIDVSEIKSQYSKSGIVNYQIAPFNDSLNIRFEPDWGGVYSKQGKDSANYYYVPLRPKLFLVKNPEKTYPLNGVKFEKFIIARSKSGAPLTFYDAKYINEEKGRPASFIPSYADFNGYLILRNAGGTKQSYRYEHGAIIPVSRMNINKEGVARTESTVTICDQECTWTGYCYSEGGFEVRYTVSAGGGPCPYPDPGLDPWDCADPGGQSIRWNLGSTNLINCREVEQGNNPIPPPPGGIRVETPNIIPSWSRPQRGAPAPKTIKTELKNPCLVAAYNAAANKDLKNWLSQALQSIFGEKSNMDLIFREVPGSELKGAMGEYSKLDSHWGVDADGNPTGGEIYINLNADLLPKASKEYIVTTILHEALHAYLWAHKIPFDGEYVNQHETMASYYTKYISSALKEIFPGISDRDRSDLSWTGLHSTLSWTSEMFKSAIKTKADQVPNDTQVRLKNIFDQQNGAKGTPSGCK